MGEEVRRDTDADPPHVVGIGNPEPDDAPFGVVDAGCRPERVDALHFIKIRSDYVLQELILELKYGRAGVELHLVEAFVVAPQGELRLLPHSGKSPRRPFVVFAAITAAVEPRIASGPVDC